MSSFLFIGTQAERIARAERYVCEELGVVLERNPDVMRVLHGDIKVEDAEQIRAHMSRAPFGEKIVCFVDIERATQQAQNALLKVFEEPHERACVICMAPSRVVLLPTILSRLHEVSVETETASQTDTLDTVQARAFLAGTPVQRSEIVQKILKEHDRIVTKRFVDMLEQLLYRKGDMRALKEIAFVQEYVKDNGSSGKMLLEHLVVTLPRFDVE